MRRRTLLMTPVSTLIARGADAAIGGDDGIARETFAGTAWAEAAASAGVADPLIVYAVALFESGATEGPGRVAPWPWTLNFGGVDVRAASRTEAQRLLSTAGPETNVDIGLMQVNLAAHHDKVRCASELLDPDTNVRIGGRILGDALRSSPNDIVLGLGRYHSWNPGRALWYGRAVWRLYVALLEPNTRLRGRLA